MLISLLISVAFAAVPPRTEAMLVRLESLRVNPNDLAPFVGDENSEVRARAALSLGRIRDGRAVDSLSMLLGDEDPAVRSAAIHALGQLPGTGRYLHKRLSVETNQSIRADIYRALGMVGDGWDIDTLVEVLQEPIDRHHTAEEVAAAANALGQMAVRGINAVGIERVVEILSQQSRRTDPAIRYAAAFALARIAPRRLTTGISETIIDAAKSEYDADIKALLIRASAKLDGVEEVLEQAQNHSSPTVRISAARAAVYSGWPGVVTLMSDPVPQVSLAAIEAVGQISTLARLELLGPIVKAGMDLKSPRHDGETVDPDLARAVVALKALKLPKFWWETDTERYSRVQTGLLPSLSMYMSEDRDTQIRAAATTNAVDPRNLFHLATTDPEGMVRMAAAQRILGDRVSLVRALSLLNSPDNMVKAAVANWLQDHPNKNSETVLLNLAGTSNDPILVHNAVLALKTLYEGQPARRRGSQGARVLLPALLGHEDPGVRSAGVELAKCLGAWPNFFEHSPSPVDAVALHEIQSAVVTTARGDIIVELYPEHAPLTVANFARLADSGFYDGLPFHRVISDFVAQGGDPRGDGWGGPGHTIPDEINALRYEAGTVGMALNGRDSGGSQWFMTLAPQPHLDDRYTVFGKIVSGLSVARTLLPGDRIENVSIERVMGPEGRAEVDQEFAESMLVQLQSDSDMESNSATKKKKKKSKKKSKTDKASKKALKQTPDGDEAEVEPNVDVEEEKASDEALPDEYVKAAEDPDLIEGEKVEVIDPNNDE